MKAAVVSRAYPGERCNGDAWVVIGPLGTTSNECRILSSTGGGELRRSPVEIDLDPGAPALLAVIDGTGHGPEAAAASARIVSVLDEQRELDLPLLARACHSASTGSRGAAVSLALLNPLQDEIRYLGVGNVTGQLVRRRRSVRPSWCDLTHPSLAPENLISRTFLNNAGIIGYRFPNNLLHEVEDFEPGDALVMFSDGISRKFDACECLHSSQVAPAVAAESILSRFGRTTDDATALVCRYGARG